MFSGTSFVSYIPMPAPKILGIANLSWQVYFNQRISFMMLKIIFGKGKKTKLFEIGNETMKDMIYFDIQDKF